MDDTDYSAHSSIYVAPLRIEKPRRTPSNGSKKSRSLSRAHSRNQSVGSQSHSSHQYTPPPTPKTSQESLTGQEKQPSTDPFLRAFYPFHPTYTPGSSTVTLPLNVGDVILVHSVHTNGWADGTMLSSGARGWLPTNYCEPYDTAPIRALLKSCLNLFELFRTGTTGGIRQSQIVITGMVAGAKHLLEITQCLTREATNVKASERVGKSRRVLLTELAALIKTSKRLPGHAEYDPALHQVEEITDELILKSFKVVLRGVRFLDIWYDQFQGTSVVEETLNRFNDNNADAIPPTPPAESFSYSMSSSSSSVRSLSHSHSESAHDGYFGLQSSTRDKSVLVATSDLASAGRESHPLPSTPHTQTPRGTSPELARDTSSLCNEPVYALAQLNTTHDALLSYLGSYIGRIHIQARFTPDVQLTQQQSVAAARELLAVVEAVCARDPLAGALVVAKDNMYEHIASLVSAARNVVLNRVEEMDEDEDGGIMIPDGGKQLADLATGCVRGAGECVAKSKFVIERIGDFLLEDGTAGIGLGITTDTSAQDSVEQVPQEELDREATPPPPTPEKTPPTPPPKNDPAPKIPMPNLAIDTNLSVAATTSSGQSGQSTAEEQTSRPASKGSFLPPVATVSPLTIEDEDRYNVEGTFLEERPLAITTSVRIENAVSSSATTATTMDSALASSIHGSEFSTLSRVSTRATTPEPPSAAASVSTPFLNMDLTRLNSQVSLTNTNDGEAYAPKKRHEDLTFNKEGQITGGTLMALVERLTIHDSTPDAVFVSTFYLTFRLFTTPAAFAEALVERFDSSALPDAGSMPVKLRVYNVFKGWLESHWRKPIDEEALPVMNGFAEGRLKEVLPAAAKRLQELTDRVRSLDGPLVPRLASSMGKSSTATTYVLPETPIPAPIITRAQLNLLKSALSPGGTSPGILDFDPLELARQLTLKESRMFCSICPEELIAQEWTKKDESLAVNVLAMSRLSTDLAHLVAESIIDVEDTKLRARVIKHWIKIADRCLEMNNYDTLMAIMCSMNASTILRLKKTWELVSHKTKMALEHLRSIIDVSKNHQNMRQRLRNHVPPCLPFLGTYLTDLTFVDVGNPSKRPTSIDGGTKQLINFDKHVKTARIISELQRFQIPYRIQEIPEMQQWIDAQLDRIHNSKSADVQNLYRRSLRLEPRETQLQRVATDLQSPPPPTPTLQKESSGKSDIFAWAHVFKTPAN